MTKEELFGTLRDKLYEIAKEHDLFNSNITVNCRALTAEGVTIVVATHDLPFAACVADTITMLFDGEDACTETPSEFFRNNLFYRATENDFTCAWGSL